MCKENETSDVSSKKSGAKSKNLAIESLRGIAAMFVVFFHYFSLITALELPKGKISEVVCFLASFGHLGVPVFFVISGYVIYLTAIKIDFDATGTTQFLSRRLLRIVPPYWAMIGFILITVGLGKEFGLFKSNEIRLWATIAHVFYLQDVLGYAPLDIAFWTLCIEVQFYIFFATLMWLAQRLGGNANFWLLGASILISVLVQSFTVIPNWLFLKHWPIFAFGCLLYMVKTEGITPGTLFLCGICLSWRAFDSPLEFLLLLMVSAIIFAPIRSVPRPFLYIGNISYSLYLVHGLVGSLLAGIMKKLRLANEFQNLGLVCSFIFIAIAIATAFSWSIEKPVIKLSHCVVAKRRPN